MRKLIYILILLSVALQTSAQAPDASYIQRVSRGNQNYLDSLRGGEKIMRGLWLNEFRNPGRDSVLMIGDSGKVIQYKINIPTSDSSGYADSAGLALNSLLLQGHNAAYFQIALGFTPENVANKATTLVSPNNTTYPTTLTVSNAIAAIPVLDTTSLNNRINLKLNIVDTTNKWVTSVTATYPAASTGGQNPRITLDTTVWHGMGFNDLRYQAAGSYENPLTFTYPLQRTANTITLDSSSGKWRSEDYYKTIFPLLAGSYSNPAWITALAWSKITGTPTTIAGYGITDYNSLWDTRLATKTTADLADATNKRYVTDANLVVINNTSGTNTGDQDLSGLKLKSDSTNSISGFVTHYQNDSAKEALRTLIATKLNIGDTTNMLNPYLRKIDTNNFLHWSDTTGKLATDFDVSLRVKYTDTGTMLASYLRAIDTTNKWISIGNAILNQTTRQSSSNFNISTSGKIATLTDSTIKITGFGDSKMQYGYWLNQLGAIYGAELLNLGLSSSTLIDYMPYGAASGISRIPLIPRQDTTSRVMYFISEYGVNDLRDNTKTVVEWAQALVILADSLVQKGYVRSRVVFSTVPYITSFGGSGANLARQNAMSDSVRAVAARYGFKVADWQTWESNRGGAGNLVSDGVHESVAGINNIYDLFRNTFNLPVYDSTAYAFAVNGIAAFNKIRYIGGDTAAQNTYRALLLDAQGYMVSSSTAFIGNNTSDTAQIGTIDITGNIKTDKNITADSNVTGLNHIAARGVKSSYVYFNSVVQDAGLLSGEGGELSIKSGKAAFDGYNRTLGAAINLWFGSLGGKSLFGNTNTTPTEVIHAEGNIYANGTSYASVLMKAPMVRVESSVAGSITDSLIVRRPGIGDLWVINPLPSYFITAETPSGTINGVNTTFTLANTPVAGTVKLYLNGQRMTITTDYTISGATITAINIPLTGDKYFADYIKQYIMLWLLFLGVPFRVKRNKNTVRIELTNHNKTA